MGVLNCPAAQTTWPGRQTACAVFQESTLRAHYISTKPFSGCLSTSSEYYPAKRRAGTNAGRELVANHRRVANSAPEDWCPTGKTKTQICQSCPEIRFHDQLGTKIVTFRQSRITNCLGCRMEF